MEPITAVLWDIDGTLLNFLEAEKAAIRACFSRFGLGECTDAMLARYSAVNVGYWKRIERGEIDKRRALTARFEDFFAGEGLDAGCAAPFNAEYQVRLGDTVVFNPGARETVTALRGRVRQYAVTNGTRTAQRRKLANSGLDRLLDGVFISEDVGVEKPDPAFFDYVFARIDAPQAETVIIGDSLSSDMPGGRNAGIRCWWYNPAGEAADSRVDRVIADLSLIPALILGA